MERESEDIEMEAAPAAPATPAAPAAPISQVLKETLTLESVERTHIIITPSKFFFYAHDLEKSPKKNIVGNTGDTPHYLTSNSEQIVLELFNLDANTLDATAPITMNASPAAHNDHPFTRSLLGGGPSSKKTTQTVVKRGVGQKKRNNKKGDVKPELITEETIEKQKQKMRNIMDSHHDFTKYSPKEDPFKCGKEGETESKTERKGLNTLVSNRNEKIPFEILEDHYMKHNDFIIEMLPSRERKHYDYFQEIKKGKNWEFGFLNYVLKYNLNTDPEFFSKLIFIKVCDITIHDYDRLSYDALLLEHCNKNNYTILSDTPPLASKLSPEAKEQLHYEPFPKIWDSASSTSDQKTYTNGLLDTKTIKDLYDNVLQIFSIKLNKVPKPRSSNVDPYLITFKPQVELIKGYDEYGKYDESMKQQINRFIVTVEHPLVENDEPSKDFNKIFKLEFEDNGLPQNMIVYIIDLIINCSDDNELKKMEISNCKKLNRALLRTQWCPKMISERMIISKKIVMRLYVEVKN